MIEEFKVEYLVVDTSAFIKNAPLQEYGKEIITEPGVIKEITSKRQLKRLVVLPYDLKVREADPEDIQFVTEFSKKTGDYPSLSLTDIKVIALTYSYEKEKVGIDHLRNEPKVKKQLVDSSATLSNDPVENLIGFYMPESNNEKEETSSTHEDFQENKKEKSFFEDLANEKNEEDFFITDDKRKSDEFSNDKNKSSDYEDVDKGWITPNNIKNIKKKIGSAVVKDKPAVVACLTMDFSMQNVLMQMGLNTASLEGKVIKEMRTFILRCYACFKTTGIMTKVFCPNCGNKTLKKVAVSLDDEGKQKIHINFQKTLSAKGKKFSLPTFQGGKHACNPILFEDQPLPDQRPTKLGCTKNDPLNDDYIAGYSPFVMRDITSRAARLGIKSHNSIKHWMKKNPNSAKRKK